MGSRESPGRLSWLTSGKDLNAKHILSFVWHLQTHLALALMSTLPSLNAHQTPNDTCLLCYWLSLMCSSA